MSVNADEVRYRESLSLPKPTTGPCECRSCRSGERVPALASSEDVLSSAAAIGRVGRAGRYGGLSRVDGYGWYPASNRGRSVCRPRWLSAYPSPAADRTVIHVLAALAVLAILAILVGGEGKVVLHP